MADGNDRNDLTMDIPSFSSPSTPSPSIPLQVCGSLTGDTVQVQGDTGELQFSVQFNIHRKDHRSSATVNNFSKTNIPVVESARDSSDTFNQLPNTNIPEPENAGGAVESAPCSSHRTPPCTRETLIYNDEAISENEETSQVNKVITRLRSGALTPVRYYPARQQRSASASTSEKRRARAETKRKAAESTGRSHDVFAKMLRRRSLPVRPCNAYAYFLIGNWRAVERASFEETSRRLSNKWIRLTKDKKKEYEDMASKDNERYRKQCMLLKNAIEQEQNTSSRAC
ncbi:uncharacterized protein LOC127259493 [Andrographis paniculata]|uniref:uncharacterized protein LOC127259493 n=1 Tax=Andrographis paniculata TaxID=175694 RepID=UPI0021E953C1|nr:uncharacterized protein LOC127259493 [Andrographis paniculata]